PVPAMTVHRVRSASRLLSRNRRLQEALKPSARSRRSMIFSVASSPAAGQARREALFPVLASWLLGESKFACLQRQQPAMFAQRPLFVYRPFTGAVCTTSSDGRFASFSLASRLSNSSDMPTSGHLQSPPLYVGRLLRASGSKVLKACARSKEP